MRITDVETIATRKYLNFKETSYIDRVGNKKQWTWAQRPNSVNAVVIAATVENNLVLIKEFRVPVSGYIYELPAGLIDPGESPEETGIREFHEETGLNIVHVTEVSPLVLNSPGLSDEAAYIMFAKAEGIIDISRHQPSEDIEVLLYSRSAIQDLMRDPDVKIGAKAYLVFREFVKYGKF